MHDFGLRCVKHDAPTLPNTHAKIRIVEVSETVLSTETSECIPYSFPDDNRGKANVVNFPHIVVLEKLITNACATLSTTDHAGAAICPQTRTSFLNS